MPEDIYPVQWAGQQAVLALPEHMDQSNASQIEDGLLSVINRGAKVLIADMTATISCDLAGTDAVVRVSQRAVVSGAEMRLVVPVQIVRRVLGLSGVERLVPIYPSLETATAADAQAVVLALVGRLTHAGTDGHGLPRRSGRTSRPVRAAGAADGSGAAGDSATAEHEYRSGELLDVVVNDLFRVGLSLQAAIDLPAEATRQRIFEALGHLDDIIREIRDTIFTSS